MDDNGGQLVEQVGLPPLFACVCTPEERPHVEQQRESESVVDLDALEAEEVEAESTARGGRRQQEEGRRGLARWDHART